MGNRAGFTWFELSDEREQKAQSLKNEPEVPLFLDALNTAIQGDAFLRYPPIGMAWELDKLDPRAAGIWGKVYAYKNGHWKGANAALSAGNWPECLKHAKRVVFQMDGDEGERMRYCIVKSLWKMGQLREALDEAELGIRGYPEKHTFHYMFAVVALELGDRLEEALERAKLATELDPANQGIKDTIKKLEDLLAKKS
jgi:tetratricopeptide (TPR) repeat protein